MKRVVARGRETRKDSWGVGGTDAPALLVILAVVGLPVCDRRGRRTSQLSSTICSLPPPHIVLTLPCAASFSTAGFNPAPACPSSSGTPLLHHHHQLSPSVTPAITCPPSAALSPCPSPPSRPKARQAVYLRPGGSVQSWSPRAATPLPAWCSYSRLPSCPDQTPPLFLLPLSLLRHHTARHSRPPPRHTVTHTHTARAPLW